MKSSWSDILAIGGWWKSTNKQKPTPQCNRSVNQEKVSSNLVQKLLCLSQMRRWSDSFAETKEPVTDNQKEDTDFAQVKKTFQNTNISEKDIPSK